ncbi:RNA-binding component of cleavage and polyadenylation factor [Malassezia sp. CBS 17886]|nr:RNA-binding component of cleavage and polyadenylation factor [Malassezia sp. CBS 17886]
MANALAFEVEYAPTNATSALFSSVRQRRLPSEDDWPHNEFAFEPFVKRELQVRLEDEDEVCPRYLKGGCELGARCPLRHIVTRSVPPPASHGRDTLRRTVCKHWLRGLCKKGEACDYLHEYDLRKVPECRFYATYGFCSAADECLYIHIDPEVKRRWCEDYERGFCARGPACAKKHVRKIACPYYLAGFCPKGPDCNMGHIKANAPSAASRAVTPLLTHRPLPVMEAFGPGGAVAELPTDKRTGRVLLTDADWLAAEAVRKLPPASSARDGTRKRELSDVLCYKCGEYGHFANVCTNPARPGGRGGYERGGVGRWR